MNKGISKWPARALNLLVVLAMVISLSAILVAPPIAAAQECNPTPVWNGCHLEVAVSTYIKTADGDFIPEDNFEAGECFYVNAVVVNTQANSTAIAPISATISFRDGDVYLHDGEAVTKEWANGNLTYASPEGLLADFWWQVCCSGPYADEVIKVNATAASPCENSPWPAEGCAEIYQGVSTTTNCLEIEIVEAPGMPDKVGELGNYFMTMPGTIAPCTNFGIKAELTNHCVDTLTNVQARISWTGSASIVGGDPLIWEIGNLAPGETKGVGWTLHCDDPGDVVVTVDSPNYGEYFTDDPVTVHQEGGYGLVVDITKPTCTTSECNPTCEIVQPSGDCGAENFIVEANLHNSGDSSLVLVYSIATVTPATGWAQIVGSAIRGPFTILPGADQTVQYNMRCIGNGTGNVTVTASGADAATGAPVMDDDVVTIRQTYLTAGPSPDPAYAVPDEVNKCQEFDVTFRYMNYSGNAWNDPSTGNITACIHWDRISDIVYDGCGNAETRTGNATMIDSVYYRRVVSGIPQGWQLLTTTPVVTGNDTTGYDSCVHIPVICDCCGAEVKWHFKCTEVGPVKFSSRIDVSQTNPTFRDHAISDSICVNQVWKAHLTADSFFFIQTDSGEMLMQDAIVPGTQFHVVIPVVNTGDADAENVQVYFIITDAPQAPCTQSFRILSLQNNGDAVSIVSQGGGAYIANFPVIPAHKAAKATLTLECLCEGDVSVWVPDSVLAWGSVKGVRGYDGNTGTAIPQDNIIVPPCPRQMEQIPFTVEILNPYTCQTFNEGQTFPVKARITNGASDDLLDVYATLTWGSGDNVALLGNQTLNGDGHSCTKLVGNITAASYTEITWELRCTGDNHDSGEVYLGVSATSTTPRLTAFTVDYPDTVNVHQIGIPTACLEVRILSPDEDQIGQDGGHGNHKAMIATGQEFAVTAKIMNNGNYPAANVNVSIDETCGSPDYVTLAEGQDRVIEVGPLAAHSFVVVTWTLWGGGDSDWGLKDCSVRDDNICVNATSTTKLADPCPTARSWGEDGQTAGDNVVVSIYPAAFLVAEITSGPETIPAGSDFVVGYKVTNYGVADAWNTSVALGVNPDGSVRIAAGQGGYTQYLGTIPGWSWGAPFNFVVGNFTVSCKAVCQSTLTIIPAGDDECGWHAIVSPDSDPARYDWVQYAGRPIESRFAISDSETVKQLDSGQLDLSITKTVDNAFPAAGQIVNFTITVTNNGPTAASGVVVTDAQPAGLTFGAAITSQGTFSSGVWTVGNLIVGGSASLKIAATATTTSQITNTAAITAVDQPDPFASNNSASVALNTPAVTSMGIALKSGWNLISLPLIPNNSAIATVLSGVSSHVVSVWNYSGGVWTSWDPGSGGDLATIVDGKGYWINMNAAATLTVNGVVNPLPPSTPPTYSVAAGWNLIGFKSTSAMTAGEYLAAIAGQWTKIWGYANGQYSAVNSSGMLQPGCGYWIAVTSAGTIYP